MLAVCILIVNCKTTVMNDYYIREIRQSDLESFENIYTCSVLKCIQDVYNFDIAKFYLQVLERGCLKRDLLEGTGYTVIIKETDNPVAFIISNPQNYLSHLYCLPEFCRNGYATALINKLEAKSKQNVSYMYANASILSYPIFKKCGWINKAGLSYYNDNNWINYAYYPVYKYL